MATESRMKLKILYSYSQLERDNNILGKAGYCSMFESRDYTEYSDSYSRLGNFRLSHIVFQYSSIFAL